MNNYLMAFKDDRRLQNNTVKTFSVCIRKKKLLKGVQLHAYLTTIVRAGCDAIKMIDQVCYFM